MAKCKICKKELTKSDRYSPTGKAPYYCNENEYLSLHNEKQNKEELYALLQEIFFFKNAVFPPLINTKIKDLTKTYSYGIIKECFKEQRACIEYSLKNKEFENTAHKIRYVFVIVANSIADVKPKEDNVNLEDNVDIDILNNIRYCSSKKDISRWL